MPVNFGIEGDIRARALFGGDVFAEDKINTGPDEATFWGPFYSLRGRCKKGKQEIQRTFRFCFRLEDHIPCGRKVKSYAIKVEKKWI